MKVTFTYLLIEHFYSIERLGYDFVEGITKVSGINNDTDNMSNTQSSNGAGKSTLFHALSQCLYNKNAKGKSTIDSMYNRVTGKPYKLTLDMLVGDKNYQIINDRGRNNITILEEGNDISPKGIKNQLALIESIVQLDFNTFITLSYLTQRNISNVLDVTSDKNIVYKFFDLDKLSTIEAKAKVRLRECKKEYASVLNQEKVLLKAIAEFAKYEQEDVSQLVAQKLQIKQHIDNIKTCDLSNTIVAQNTLLQSLKKDISTVEQDIALTKNDRKHINLQLSKLEQGTCPTCGNTEVTSLVDTLSGTLSDISARLKQLQADYDKLSAELVDITTEIKQNKLELKERLVQYQSEFDKIDKQILVIEERNRNFEKFKATYENMVEEKEQVAVLKKEVQVKLNFLNPLLQVIKSGEITQVYLESFVKFFNIKLTELGGLLDTDLQITAVEEAGGVKFIISHNDNEIEYSLLSSGEQTRVSLIVLIATILTLEVITNSATNFIVFDELLSVLDEAGLSVFKTLLNTLKKDKNVFVVLHHDELEQDFFDREFLITKVDGLSTLEVK